MISGGLAGGLEGFATVCSIGLTAILPRLSLQYPFEFAKTSVQLKNQHNSNNPLTVILSVTRSQGISALYTGCSSLVIGAMGKAAVRFACFDTIKAQLADSSGNVTFARGILAGMCTGVAESLVAVTPTERVKTALVDDAKGAKRFRNGFHVTTTMIRENGISEIYRGFMATTVKQAATSAVRMGSYTILKQQSTKMGVGKSPAVSFGLGATAGVITVYATQPFDTLKTRSQAVTGKGIVEAFQSVIRDAGVIGLWKGSTMRLGRLVLSGGIIFSIYEQTSAFLTKQGL